MAIDPDVQFHVDDIYYHIDQLMMVDADTMRRVLTLEQSAPPPPSSGVGGDYDVRFDPSNFSAAAVNEAAVALSANEQGGKILIDGEGVDLIQEAPIFSARGVEIVGYGVPNVNGKVRTLLVPSFSNDPHFELDSRNPGGYEAWGAWRVGNITVQNKQNKAGVRVADIEGGNHSRLYDVASQGNGYEYGLRFYEGRSGKSDAQYSFFDRINIYGAKFPLSIERNVPDISFRDCMWYGKNKGGSSAPEAGSIAVRVESNSVRFYECENQFTDVGWDINANHCLIEGGAWEAYSGWPQGTALTAFRFGPKAEDVYVTGHSFANLWNAQDRILADPAARYIGFKGCMRLRPNHVRPEFQKWVEFQVE